MNPYDLVGHKILEWKVNLFNKENQMGRLFFKFWHSPQSNFAQWHENFDK